MRRLKHALWEERVFVARTPGRTATLRQPRRRFDRNPPLRFPLGDGDRIAAPIRRTPAEANDAEAVDDYKCPVQVNTVCAEPNVVRHIPIVVPVNVNNRTSKGVEYFEYLATHGAANVPGNYQQVVVVRLARPHSRHSRDISMDV
ncbi:MAG TPA: hypothetical protein VGP86_08190 [Xanthobacteraceae bacterium]|jgi:hypothetical protein|nr:hypothetical protein [Xanthobacteraceae bacterium]